MEKKETPEELYARFIAATPEEKRVIIAQDVIAQINVKKFIASPGNYLSINTNLERSYRIDKFYNEFLNKSTELQKVIQDDNYKCEVCGIGACFSSLINIADNFKIDNTNKYYIADAGNENGMTEELTKYFSLDQLKLIEAAFEYENLPNYVEEYFFEGGCMPMLQDALNFGEGYPNDTERLLAIMKNIIKNKGTFVAYV